MRQALAGLLAGIFAVSLFAHDPQKAAASIDLGKGKVSIDYGTPALRGRNLDEMIQPGVPWRMGMNDPTTLETTVALDFAGKQLPPGKYALFARSDDQKKWTLLISKELNSRFDPATVVLEAPMEFSRATDSQEVLKIALMKEGAGAALTVAWGLYRVRTNFKAA